MKRLMVLMLSLVLALGCLNTAAAEAPSLAGQYYTYAYTAEGYGDYTFFFHFYEEDPVLGAVFYAGLSNNRINFAGLYTVEEAEYAYKCFKNRDEAAAAEKVYTEGTAPYTVHFYNWLGEEIDTCGWDGSILYNDCTTITGSGSGPVFYHLDAEGKHQAAYDGEAGVAYLDFVAVDDPTSTVSLCHNMTYTDMTMYFIDGSWKLSYDENKNAVYALTPFDEAEAPVTLTVASDQKTAVYTDAAGSTIEMVNAAASGPKALYAGEAAWHVAAYDADAVIAVTLFDDNTCTLTSTIYGNSDETDVGTYTMNADHSITFAFENAGELTAKLDMSVMGVVLQYVNEGTRLGAMDVTLPINRVEEEAPAAQLLFSFTGTYTNLDVYDDGSYTFTYAGAGLTEKGTWSFENYQFSITQSNGTVIAATMDEAHALQLAYVAEANEMLKDTFTCDSGVWGPALIK